MSGFNGSGVYSRGFNWVNDAAASIPITASRVDSDMSDVVNAFNITVTRDGQGKMSAAFQAIAGSTGAPSLTFQGGTSTGFYLSGSSTGVAGSLVFGSTGAGLQADMSNATIGNRWFLQSSTTNGNSAPMVLPNGSGTQSTLNLVNNSTPTNSGLLSVGCNTSAAFINSTVFGSGTQLALQLQIAGTSALTIATTGNVAVPTPSSGIAFTVAQTTDTGNVLARFTGKTSSPGQSTSIQLVGYQAAFQVINAASTQNWYFGVNDADSSNLWIGAGYGPAQGLTAAMKVAVSGLTTSVNIDNTGTYTEVGYRDLPQNTQSGNYSLALTDRGKLISCTNSGSQTITIPANASVAFPVGTVISIENQGTTSVSVAITSDTLRQAGTTNTGTRTLSVHGLCSLVKRASTVWYINGAGVT